MGDRDGDSDAWLDAHRRISGTWTATANPTCSSSRRFPPCTCSPRLARSLDRGHPRVLQVGDLHRDHAPHQLHREFSAGRRSAVARWPAGGQMGRMGARRRGRDIPPGIRGDGWDRAARAAAAGGVYLLTHGGTAQRGQLDPAATALLALYGVPRRGRQAPAVPSPDRPDGVRGLVAMALGTPGVGIPGGLDAGAGARWCTW